MVFPRGQCACVGESACYGRSDLGTLLHRRSRGTSAGGLLPSSPGSPPVLCRAATHSGWGRRLRQAGRKRQRGNQVWIRTLQMKPTTFPADRGWAGAGTSPRENNGQPEAGPALGREPAGPPEGWLAKDDRDAGEPSPQGGGGAASQSRGSNLWGVGGSWARLRSPASGGRQPGGGGPRGGSGPVCPVWVSPVRRHRGADRYRNYL